MKSFAAPGVAIATCLLATAADRDPISLIAPYAYLVSGVNAERYRSSALNRFFPLELPVRPAAVRDGALTRVFFVTTQFDETGSALTTILQGAPSIADFRKDTTQPVSNRDGIPILQIDRRTVWALLDSSTGVLASPADAERAIWRWHGNESPKGEFHEKVRALNDIYDNWFFMKEPLYQMDRIRARSKPVDEFLGLISEARGGVRLGPINEFRIEALARSPEDAATLAGIARWLPGYFALRHHGPEPELAELVENVSATASGNLVTLTFTVEERKLEERIREWEEEYRNSRH